MKEIWKDITGYDYQYKISNLGRIKKITENKEVILKQGIGGSGYYKVNLRKNKKQITYNTHRLIAIYFIPNPLNKPEVNHKNGIKTDISIDNLEWNTCSENKYHAYKNNLINHPKGLQHHFCKFKSEDDIRFIRNEGLSMTNKSLAELYNVCQTSISLIKTMKNYKHIL